MKDTRRGWRRHNHQSCHHSHSLVINASKGILSSSYQHSSSCMKYEGKIKIKQRSIFLHIGLVDPFYWKSNDNDSKAHKHTSTNQPYNQPSPPQPSPFSYQQHKPKQYKGKAKQIFAPIPFSHWKEIHKSCSFPHHQQTNNPAIL